MGHQRRLQLKRQSLELRAEGPEAVSAPPMSMNPLRVMALNISFS